ncbi:MAG: dihydropteroate synthase [Kiritimatiellae bacterium]|nr:dihydropteroate synthase [Kiritimatiellia bacterium]
MRIPFRGRPLVMGIVNVTPDSFSDGGRWMDPDAAVAHALRLVEEGADLLDIGGESTRPGAEPVPPEAEAERVVPVIRRLAALTDVPISVDTRRAEVADLAIAAGAVIVNDVAPLTEAPEMAEVVRKRGAGLVAMHARGTPQTMADMTAYADVTEEVAGALEAAVAFALDAGIARVSVVVDPGIGFAKDTDGNCALLARMARLTAIAPVLIGASRKRFIGEICGEPEAALRDGGSVGVAVWAALHGASVVRVHAVRESVQALKMVERLKVTER